MSDLAMQVINRQVEALKLLPAVIQSAQYQSLVGMVTEIAKSNRGERVLMAGVGKNSNIASKISQTMASLGIPSGALNVSHLGHGDYGFIGEEDLIIHISRSGTTREMLEAIEHIMLIRPNVTQVLIHCKPSKPMNHNVAFELCLGAVKEGDTHELAPTTSTTQLLCILDCISVQASDNIGFSRLDFLKYHPDGSLGAMLKAESEKPTPKIIESEEVVSKPGAALKVTKMNLTQYGKDLLTVKDQPEPGKEFS
jgi:D-arabinose 5-phosphate isomerase GutQ